MSNPETEVVPVNDDDSVSGTLSVFVVPSVGILYLSYLATGTVTTGVAIASASLMGAPLAIPVLYLGAHFFMKGIKKVAKKAKKAMMKAKKEKPLVDL